MSIGPLPDSRLLDLARDVAADTEGSRAYGPRLAAEVRSLSPHVAEGQRALLWERLVTALRSGDGAYAHRIVRVMTKGQQ